MKKAIFILLVMISISFPPAADSELLIDLSQSTCKILDSQTIQVSNIGFSDYSNLYWANFQWDANTYFFIPIYAEAEVSDCPSRPSGNNLPFISLFSLPSSVNVGEKFCISYTYCDPDGPLDVKEHYAIFSDGSEIVIAADGSGKYRGCDFSFAQPGASSIQVYVVDRSGNKSNVLGGSVTVVEKRQTTKRILFEYHYENHAWGVQISGWVIDSGGTVTDTVTSQVIGHLSPGEVSQKALLIDAASRGTISGQSSRIRDFGQSSYYAYAWDTGEKDYNKVLLSTCGDFSIGHNTDPSAVALDTWLKQLPFFQMPGVLNCFGMD